VGARASIYVTRVADPRAYGLIETERDERILRFREKPGPEETITTDRINAGVYLLDAALLARIPSDRPVSIEREFFPALIADRIPFFAWEWRGYWRDIGTPAAYHAAQMDLLDGRVATSLRPAGSERDGVWVAPTAKLGPRAVVAGPSVVGPGTTLDDGCAVGPYAVLGEGVHVAGGARVARSVIWERTAIAVNASLDGCVVGAGSRIGAGAVLGSGIVLESGAAVAAHARLST
jgi:mannose-1-phosphate guanylyltransferase